MQIGINAQVVLDAQQMVHRRLLQHNGELPSRLASGGPHRIHNAGMADDGGVIVVRILASVVFPAPTDQNFHRATLNDTPSAASTSPPRPLS